jgi:uncharacterized protein Veg
MSHFKNFSETSQKSINMSSQKSSFNSSSPFGGRSFGGRNGDNTSFGKKETSHAAKNPRRDDDDGWTHVSGKSNSRSNGTVGGKSGNYKGGQHSQSNGYSKDEKAQKTKLFYATKKIDDIMSTSNGNISDIESHCIQAFNSVSSKEEKAKIVETVVSYSLHELLDESKFFGKIISTDMSVHASLGSIKERDGYDVFTWAVWTRYGDKRSINNLTRDSNDIIKTVQQLLSLKVTPFHINTKSESIIHTLDSCVKNGKITTETRDAIYSIVLETNTDASFIYECIRASIFDIYREGVNFNKSLVSWALQNSEVFDKIINMSFNHDMDRVGLADIQRSTADIEYFTNFKKLIELVNSDVYHNDFAKFFSNHPVDKTAMVGKIAKIYMDKIFETYPKIYEYNVSDGYGSTEKEGICFKNMESLGAFIWDVSQYIDIDESCLEEFGAKVKIGYGIRGLKTNKSNIEMLKEIYPTVHIVSQILIENAFRSAKVPFVNTDAPKVEIKEDKVDHFKNLKTGLEKIGSNKITFSPEISDTVVDDAIYSLNKIKDKVDQIDFARAFTYQACLELFSDNQISHIVPLINYLDLNNIIKKGSFSKLLEEETDEIVENTECDNPKASKIVMAIKSACV